MIYPFKSKGITKPVLGHSVSPDGKRIALVVPCDVYYSTDGGTMFARLPLAGVRRFTELISVALHPTDAGLMLIGTSSNGVYVSRDGGSTARKIKAGVPGEPVRTPNFLEEIRSLCFGGDGDTFYAGFGNGGGVYRGSISRADAGEDRACRPRHLSGRRLLPRHERELRGRKPPRRHQPGPARDSRPRKTGA